jgi:transposase
MGRLLGRKPNAESVVGRAAKLYNEGVDIPMIAERMGIQVGTVYAYLSRARSRKLLKSNEPIPMVRKEQP